MRVRVAGRDGGDPERLGELAQPGVPARVAALVRALELDVEPVATEGGGEAGCRGRVMHGKAMAGATGQADQALVELLEPALLERGRKQLGLAAQEPRVAMRLGQEATEVRV